MNRREFRFRNRRWEAPLIVLIRGVCQPGQRLADVGLLGLGQQDVDAGHVVQVNGLVEEHIEPAVAVSEQLLALVVGYTRQQTTLGEKRAGDPVNLETDIIGKYVEQFTRSQTQSTGITAAFLQEHGFPVN